MNDKQSPSSRFLFCNTSYCVFRHPVFLSHHPWGIGAWGTSINTVCQPLLLQWVIRSFASELRILFALPASDTTQGPVGLSGIKTICVPHFLYCRKRPSFSLCDLPWVPMGRFKQLLIREGSGCETREKQTIRSSPGARSCFPSNGYTQQYLWGILRRLKPPPGGRI